MDEPTYNSNDLSEYLAYHREQAEKEIDARLRRPLVALKGLVQMSNVAFAYISDPNLSGGQSFNDQGYAGVPMTPLEEEVSFDQAF